MRAGGNCDYHGCCKFAIFHGRRVESVLPGLWIYPQSVDFWIRKLSMDVYGCLWYPFLSVDFLREQPGNTVECSDITVLR